MLDKIQAFLSHLLPLSNWVIIVAAVFAGLTLCGAGRITVREVTVGPIEIWARVISGTIAILLVSLWTTLLTWDTRVEVAGKISNPFDQKFSYRG
jgi:hypothetical protein